MKRYLLSIILCLCASCAWAFPPGFIGAVASGGGAAAGPTYTTVLSSYWDGTGEIDTGGTGVGMPWYSETDSTSVGNLSGGKYVVNAAANGVSAYLREVVTARSDWMAKVDITPSVVTGWGNSAYIDILSLSASVRLTATSGGELDNVKIYYQNGSSITTYSTPYTFSFNTSPHTFELHFKNSSATDVTDGEMSLLIDGNVVIGPTAINTYTRDSGTNAYVGIKANTGGTGTSTVSFDNFVFGYK